MRALALLALLTLASPTVDALGIDAPAGGEAPAIPFAGPERGDLPLLAPHEDECAGGACRHASILEDQRPPPIEAVANGAAVPLGARATTIPHLSAPGNGSGAPESARPPGHAHARPPPRIVPAASLPPSLPFGEAVRVEAAERSPGSPAADAKAPRAPAPRADPATAPTDGAPAAWSAPRAAAAVALVVAVLSAYSRVSSRGDALASPVRARIVAIVQARGVVSLPELARTLGLGRTTIEHHLRVLARCSVLSVSREGRAVVVALPALRASAPPPAVRRSPACQALLAILAARPEGLAREEVHREAAAIPVRTRNHAIRALAERGLVVEANGRLVATARPGSQA